VNGIITSVRPVVVSAGRRTVVSGRLVAGATPVAGELLELQRAQSPSSRFRNIAHTLTRADGRYRFPAIAVFRDARFRVADEGARGRHGAVVAVRVEPRAYPSSARIASAARYLAARAGSHAFAVIDSHGALAGSDVHTRFHSASIVKTMLLVAYLRELAARHRGLDRSSTALLYPMIHSSDNDAASAILSIVGQAALDRVAADAHMSDFEDADGWWAFTEVSAADLVRFISVQDALIPPQFDGYARYLESTIEPSQSWGIPAVAKPRFEVFFKGGWLPQSEGLVNQVARLEGARVVFSLAVLTREDPSMAYGEETIAGVTRQLLGRT
jgi:hypothetical protein